MKKVSIIGTITILCISSLIMSGCGNTQLTGSNVQQEETKSQIADGWNDIDGSKYYYENGEKKTGWIKVDNAWYYLGDDGFVYYQCTAVGLGAANTFIIKYPKNREKYYDGIVNTLYNSFATPGISEALLWSSVFVTL